MSILWNESSHLSAKSSTQDRKYDRTTRYNKSSDCNSSREQRTVSTKVREPHPKGRKDPKPQKTPYYAALQERTENAQPTPFHLLQASTSNQFQPNLSQKDQVPSNGYTNYRCGAHPSSPTLPLLPVSTAPTSSTLVFALPLQPLHSSPNVPLRLRPLPVVSPSVPLRTISRSRPPSSGPCSSPSTAIDSRHRLGVCGSALPLLL